MTFSESDVKRRVVNILTPKKTSGLIVTLLTVMVVASGCAMATDSSQKSSDAEISGEIVAENQYSDASQENTDIINSVPVLYYTDIISKNESELINEYKANRPDGFLWPVPEYSYVSRQFTGRYNEGGHDGIDICGAYGTPVYAAESGIVITANYTARGYGVYVVIDHGGFETLYSHCSELTVSMGQNVSKGDLIGYIGSTGNSTGNHCHFEVKVGDTRYNPAHWFE